MSKTPLALVAQPSRFINFLKNLLEKQGYRVSHHTQGLEVLNQLSGWGKDEANGPKIFLVEHPLPDIGGGEMAIRIRDEKAFLKTPILLLVDPGQKETEGLVKQFGCQGLLLKNTGHEGLLQEIASWVGGKAPSRAATADDLAILLKKATPRPVIKSPGEINKDLDVAQILAALWRKKMSGTLVLENGKVMKTLWLENGQVFFAQSNQHIDRLGDLIEKKGYATRETIESALVLGNNPDLRMGEILVETATITFEQLTECVQIQIKTMMFSTLAWQNGSFVFRPLKDAEKEPIRLQIEFGLLLKEGIYASLDEDHILDVFAGGKAKLLPHLDLQVKLSAIALLPEETHTSHLLKDYHLQVSNLIEKSELPQLETLQFFYFLYCMGFCEVLK